MGLEGWRVALLRSCQAVMRSGRSPCKGVYDDCAVLATRKNVLLVGRVKRQVQGVGVRQGIPPVGDTVWLQVFDR